MVRVQEELNTLSWRSYAGQRLLQTDQLTGYRVRWKRADHRLGGSFRRIASSAAFIVQALCHAPVVCHHFTVRYD